MGFPIHPYLDDSQWPEYNGPHLKPDPELKVLPKGRRRTKRFRGDMDDLGGYTAMKQFGSGHFMEPKETSNCGGCDETRHNIRTCPKKRKTLHKVDNSQGGDRGGSGVGRGSGFGGGRVGRTIRRIDRGRPVDVLLNPDG